LIRRVRGGEREVEEQRLLRVVRADQPDGLGAEERGDVAFFVERLVVADPVALAVRLVAEVVDLAE
jgi:hypothetical protein